MQKIVIEVRGGVLTTVYSENDDLDITVVDWDNIEGGDKPIHSFPYSSFAEISSEISQII